MLFVANYVLERGKFSTLQGPAFLKNYTPTTKPVLKVKEGAENLEYHFGSPEQHQGKITRVFWAHIKCVINELEHGGKAYLVVLGVLWDLVEKRQKFEVF